MSILSPRPELGSTQATSPAVPAANYRIATVITAVAAAGGTIALFVFTNPASGRLPLLILFVLGTCALTTLPAYRTLYGTTKLLIVIDLFILVRLALFIGSGAYLIDFAWMSAETLVLATVVFAAHGSTRWPRLVTHPAQRGPRLQLAHTRGLDDPGVSREISRARRFERGLAIVVAEPTALGSDPCTGVGWIDRQIVPQLLRDRLCDIAIDAVRDYDLVIGDGHPNRIAILCPEAARRDLVRLEERIDALARTQAEMSVDFAVADFPTDAFTVGEIKAFVSDCKPVAINPAAPPAAELL